jgi:2'-5' RNA ligase
MTPQTPHYFLAIPVSERVRSVLQLWSEQLQGSLPFKQWVHPGDYHITLAFLGKASFQTINELKKVVQETVATHESFNLQVRSAGTFGKKERPRIFWAGVSAGDELYNLQHDVYIACESADFELDKRPFRPHITIAKKWMGETTFNHDKIDEIVQPKEGKANWRVSEVVLYQTHLNRTPTYQPLKVFSLHDRKV